MSNPLSQLHVLLLSLFSADELRRWIRFQSDYQAIAAALPGQTAAASVLVDAVIESLQRRGLIDADFFQQLEADRPGRSEEIKRVAALWLGVSWTDEGLGAAGAEPDGPLLQGSVVADVGAGEERAQEVSAGGQASGGRLQDEISSEDAQIDALIITALKSELDALLAVKDGLLSGWTKSALVEDAHQCVLAGADGPIRVLAMRPTRMGGVSTASIASRLVEKIKPRCLAMCGVCAGHPGDTAFGDVVIADRLFQHDEGKIKPEGRYGDLWVASLRDDWLRIAQNLAGPAVGLAGYASPEAERWKWWFLGELSAGRDPRKSTAYRRYLPDDVRSARLKSLLKEGLIRRKGTTSSLTEDGKDALEEHLFLNDAAVTTLPFHVVVGPMGSGSAVEAAGEIWDRLAKGGMRKALAVEMEAAALGRVAHEHDIPCVVAKGVMDHADAHKDDRFKAFAARASAEVLCRFLRLVRRFWSTRGRAGEDRRKSSRERLGEGSSDDAQEAQEGESHDFTDEPELVDEELREEASTTASSESEVGEQVFGADSSARLAAPAQREGKLLRFAVALSFPGEKRGFVSRVANYLAGKLSTSRVLYDHFHREEFARPDLGFHLPELYAKHSELVVVFVCDDYEQKRWCGAEWRKIHDLIFNGHDERVMLVRLDSMRATLRGLSETAGFYEVNTRLDSPESVAQAILRRREQYRRVLGHGGRVYSGGHHGAGGATTADVGEDAQLAEEHAADVGKELERELDERQRRLEKSLGDFFAPKSRAPLRSEIALRLEVSASQLPRAIAVGRSETVLEAFTDADEALLERNEGDSSDMPSLVEKALPVLLFREFGHACKRQLSDAQRELLSLQAAYPDSADAEIAGAEGADAELIATVYGVEGVHRLGRPPPGGFDLDGDLATDDTLAELLDRLDYEELSEQDRARLKSCVFRDLAGQPAFVGMLSAPLSKETDERRRAQLSAELQLNLARRRKKGKRSFYVLLDPQRSDALWESIAACVSQTFQEVLTARLAGAGESEQYARIIAPIREIYSRRYKQQHEPTKRD